MKTLARFRLFVRTLGLLCNRNGLTHTQPIQPIRPIDRGLLFATRTRRMFAQVDKLGLFELIIIVTSAERRVCLPPVAIITYKQLTSFNNITIHSMGCMQIEASLNWKLLKDLASFRRVCIVLIICIECETFVEICVCINVIKLQLTWNPTDSIVTRW